MGGGAGHVDGERLPGGVGTGRVAGLRGRGLAVHGGVAEMGDCAPVVWTDGSGGVGCGAAARTRGAGRGRRPEKIGAGDRLDGLPRVDVAGQSLEQVPGILYRVAGVDARGRLAAPVEHGEAGGEVRAAPRVGAAVDGGAEQKARGRVEGGEGLGPGCIVRRAVGGREGDEPAAGREHREGGADVVEVRMVTDALDAG